MCGEVCVVVETLRGSVTDITFTMLAAARQIADGLKTKVTALLIGHDVQKLAGELGKANRVVCVGDASLADFNPEAYLAVLSGMLEQHKPRVVLFGHTAMGTDLACGLAQRLHVPVATSCRTFTVADGGVQYSAPTCGGKLIATGPLPEPTCLATVMPGGYKPDDGRGGQAPAVESVAAPAGLDQVRTKFQQYIEPPATDVDIAKQPVLVSVGRGIQNQDNLTVAEKLAEALGGVVCGSRPVVDQGWLPTTRLVGKSGKQVKPKLYLAIGISGAPEHLEGVPEADLILAVNTDAKAPIFDVAHFGATCNALELMPALAEKLTT
ncbi:MAG: electron transfer flavoprotein subunit alpha/FixB family protein [Phycisphaerae bacterium]|jgi:electron transfer flavoprotein alpha subunit